MARNLVAGVMPSTRASYEMADTLAPGASVRKNRKIQVPLILQKAPIAQNLVGFSSTGVRTEAKYAGRARIRSDCEKNRCGIRSLRYSSVLLGPRFFSVVSDSHYI